MDDVQTTFQSRLSSRLNRLSQKLNDNAIRLSGTISDCIKISLKTSPTGDILSRKVEDIDVVPVVFPALKDIPLKKVTSTTGEIVTVPYTFEIQPIEVLIPLSTKVDQDDLIIKFYENTESHDPYIAVLQVKDMLGTFGARTIVYHKYILTNYDGKLPPKIIEWVLDMARRRQILHW